MKFIVTRTSSLYSLQPCLKAIKEVIPNWDYRSFKSEEEFNAKGWGGWRDNGTEHGTWSGGIKRRIDDVEVWTIELESLQDLLDFCNKNDNRIVITTVSDPNYHYPLEYPTLEIYDYYRE